MVRITKTSVLLLVLIIGLWSVVAAPDADDHYCQELLSMTSEEMAAEKYSGSMLRLTAECYLGGLGGAPKDRKVAKKLLQQAEAMGDSGAKHMLSSIRLFWADDPSEQRRGFEGLMDEYLAGSAFAAGKIGYAYHRGLAVEADDAQALRYYEIAAKGGMTRWQLLLSRIYEVGLYGVQPDPEKAKYWREYWPKVHVEVYECVLAVAYADGLAFEKNEQLADHFFNECSALGTSGLDRWLEGRDAWRESHQ